MAEHRIVTSREQTWPNRPGKKSLRIGCTGCDLSLKVAGTGVDEAVDAIITAHERRG